MESQDFLNKIIELGITYSHKKEDERNRWRIHWVHERPKYKKEKLTNPPTLDHFLYHEWRTGGQSGGSCWDTDDSTHYGISGDPEPDFVDLDKILENLCPTITFLQYKRLIADIIRCDERVENEYYGNYTNYGIKMVRLGDLCDKLNEMKLI
jgi:hypothetical protein